MKHRGARVDWIPLGWVLQGRVKKRAPYGATKTRLCMLESGRVGGLAARAPNKGGDWRGGL